MIFLFALALALPTQVDSGPRDPISVHVLTFGPGTHPFFKFGHNAIWIQDREARTNEVFNFGTFNFESIWLIPQFLLGRFEYWLSVDDIGYTLSAYRHDDRSVLAQELSLTMAQKRSLQAALTENAKPENMKYRYDYYADNCSTRVRDPIDRIIGGALKRASQAPADLSFRQHTLRLTHDVLWEYIGLDILMGDYIDKPIKQWDEMFLPGKLAEGLRRVRLPDGTPLVKIERQLVQSSKPPPPDKPPHWQIYFCVAGTVLGALVWWLTRGEGRLAHVVGVTMAIVIATLGLIFLMLWMFTDHHVAYGNENLLPCTPLLFLLVPALAGGTPTRRTRTFAISVLLCAILGFALKPLPWFDQDNWRILFLFAPMTAALGWRALRLTHDE